MFMKIIGLGCFKPGAGKNRIKKFANFNLVWEDRIFCYHANVNGFYLWISVYRVKMKLLRTEVTDSEVYKFTS